MSVRGFDGSDDVITLDNGIVGAFNNGSAGMTLLLVVKPMSAPAGGAECLFSANNGTNTMLSIYQSTSTTVMVWGADDPSGDFTATITWSADWQMIGVTKAAGTNAPRFHRRVLGSGSWGHANASSSNGTTANSMTNFKAGSFGSGGFRDMRLAVAAFWTSSLSDGTIETLESTATTQGLYDATPAALWDFNQASTGTNVTDLMGNGADQTAITGTTVVEGDDPSWTFGLSGGAQQIRPDADTTTTGWTDTPLYSKVNDESDATVITATLALE